MTYRVVVLGGFGHFGARIVRALAATPTIHVIAAGRHPGEVAVHWPDAAPGRISTCRLDIDAGDFMTRLAATGADALVHTAGPFQGQAYAVARRCLQAGMHYIDLADGRAFVRDFAAALDAPARQAQRVAISGASTLPALSSAVVDALLPQFSALHEIRMVIAPAQATPLGLATVRAVLSYCGMPFSWWHDGRWQQVVGWAQPERVRFAHLAGRLAAPCDVPDHDLLPQRYPGVRTVQFRAALEVAFLQRCLAAIAWLRQHGMPLPMERLAAALARAGRCFDRFGTELGGMRVRLRGVGQQGLPLQLDWDLTAPMLHGPEIPCFAAILLIRKLAAGQPLPVGAHACMGLLTLDDFEGAFSAWQMTTAVTRTPE
ncbi:saccharopine dehydrogenase NADP-binding domain-containing protein [Xanthomonas sp. NCPPB 1067]|uniref:Saccharopine dehydrogenase n=1 Tax=Xanthomonas melonis TaxID=56456 RepID=A0A2S7DCD2_9XANT|nr:MULTISPECIES: saccharopine dehydrogenase NADP-binding domain-containing protein [Xanthomonas]MCC4587844.1 saccharopine dehydrogenase NADP-binding domain-containing protein [Xanthomonas sp. NCPPB 1067]MCC4602079.1 saccharopine dehydrogenase NADP-binding domain-containing protein [Xanthomonas melonis]MCD0245393.1 saccharopine dehydrogenase NADP-binding domain-containing protein [Xanthomonas melonis]PPU71450.1 saccharopine dehydrogenase [Xanthomonas melonis]